MVKPGQKIVVWFSCGAASAVAAKLTIDKYKDLCEVVVVNTAIKEEDSDNRRFLEDVVRWVELPVSLAVHKNYPASSTVDLWEERKFMSNRFGAVCTKVLKKEARYQWEEVNKPDWHVLGFTADEVGRYKKFIKTERENVLPILIEANITKTECFLILQKAGIRIPNIYNLGYPNANCIGCVKATSPTYWNHVRRMHPNVFIERAEQSRRLGVKLARFKGKRVFLDELPVHAQGRPMANMNFECGIFCEEWSPNKKE